MLINVSEVIKPCGVFYNVYTKKEKIRINIVFVLKNNDNI